MQPWSSRGKKSLMTRKNESARNKSSSLSSSSSKSPSPSSSRGISRWRTLCWTTWRGDLTSIDRWHCQIRSSNCPCCSWSVSQIAELKFLKTIPRCTSSCPLTGNSRYLMRTSSLITWASLGPPPKSWTACSTQISLTFWSALSSSRLCPRRLSPQQPLLEKSKARV